MHNYSEVITSWGVLISGPGGGLMRDTGGPFPFRPVVFRNRREARDFCKTHNEFLAGKNIVPGAVDPAAIRDRRRYMPVQLRETVEML